MKGNSMRLLICIVLFLGLIACNNDEPAPASSDYYFPPIGSSWETITPASLGWNEAAIPAFNKFLEDNNTRAFIILKDGKIVMEEYFGKQLVNTALDFNAASNWYWASAGKTLTSAAVGIAQSQGKINFDEASSKYLGAGWSSLTPTQENQITVRHHLTMTTGLDDNVANADCTDPSCLIYKTAPGTRWAYHNAPYTLLDKIVANATSQTLNNFLNQQIINKTGMDGTFIKTGDNNVFYSTARSMARFGLLLLTEGKWTNVQVIPEPYVNLMTNTSQNLNLSYGYLTWLNGKQSFMVPTLQNIFPGSVSPNAPNDMFAAMGKNGQLINVVRSQNLVVIRMGDAPDNNLVPFTFQDDLWKELNKVIK